MKRFLPIAVIAFLATLVATPVNAGYLIIRILFEGTPTPGLDNDTEPGAGMYGGRMPGSPGSPGGPSYGSGLGPPGGFGTGGGRPPMPGPGTTGGTTTPAPATETDPTRSIVVVIPVNSDLTKSERFDPARAMNESTNPMWKPVLTLVHRGQRIKTHLFADSVTVQWYENLLSTPAYRRTHDQDVQEKHWRWTKNRADTKLLYDTIRSAMEEGYVDLAMNFSDELLESVAGKESTLFPDVAAFVKAYKSLQGAIKKTPDTPNKASYWQQRLAARDVLTRGHYSLIYWDSPPEEVERRIALLEENFRAFYLLSALRGVELPVPDAPLIAVLPRNANQVVQVAAALDAPTTFRSDGAYSEEHDILVLSPERLDGIGQTFLRQVQQIYREGVSRDSLLVGKGPKIDAQEKDGGKKPDEVAWMQTMALVERFVDDNAAIHAVSREGSRQLLYATGQLQRHILLPRWLSSGLPDTFSRPRDPAYIRDAKGKWSVAVDTTTGYGGPNYVLQRYWLDLQQKKEFHPDRTQLLKNVLTDAYFEGLRNPREVNDPDPRKKDTSGIALHSGGGGTVAGGSTSGPPGTGGSLPPPGGGRPNYGGSFSPGPRPGGGGQPNYGGSLGPRPGGGGGGSALGPPSGGSALGPPSGGSQLGPPGMGGQSAVASAPAEEDPNVKLRRDRDRLRIKAEVTSWALCYYLSRERPKEFRKFLDELSRLPRDLPLDGAVVTAAFLRAFNLDGSHDSLHRFANAWFDYMNSIPRVSHDIELLEPKKAENHPGGTPGAPGFPGGGKPGIGGKPGVGR